MSRQKPRKKLNRRENNDRHESAKLQHMLLAEILEYDGVTQLVEELEAQHLTGRPGYPIASKMAGVLAQYLYAIPTITGLVRAIKDNPNLRKACGIEGIEQVPSEDAFYRFRKKLIDNPALQAGITRVINTLALMIDDFGTDVAIDSTDIEAWCNTTRNELRDKDAAWAKRNFRMTPKGKEMDDYYGYKLHLLTDANHEIPIGWTVTPANNADCTQAMPIFEEAIGEFDWFAPEHFLADKGYDDRKIHEKLEGQYDCHPIIPLRNQRTVHKDSFDEHGCPICYQGEKFIWNGSDYKRKRSNWICPVNAGRMQRKTGLTGCACGDGMKI